MLFGLILISIYICEPEEIWCFETSDRTSKIFIDDVFIRIRYRCFSLILKPPSLNTVAKCEKHSEKTAFPRSNISSKDISRKILLSSWFSQFFRSRSQYSTARLGFHCLLWRDSKNFILWMRAHTLWQTLRSSDFCWTLCFSASYTYRSDLHHSCYLKREYK